MIKKKRKVTQQLDDPLFYEKLKSDPTKTFREEFHGILSPPFFFLETEELLKKDLDFMEVKSIKNLLDDQVTCNI